MNKLEQFKKDIKTIEYTYDQYYHGWHLSPDEWQAFRGALARVNKLTKLIENETGII